MSVLQTTTFWAAVIAYTVATVALFAGVAWRNKALFDRAALVVTPLALVTHLAAFGARWYEAGHFPFIGNYEGALFGALLIAVAFVVVSRVWPNARVLAVVALPAVLVTLGYGLTRLEPVGPVTVVYQSPWLLVHFVFSWSTYAVYTVVAGLAVASLVKQRAERRGTGEKGFSAWVPSPERVDAMSLPLVGFGFLQNALLLATGSIWAYRLWGQYWAWDPVEIWSLLTWLGYGFYLHAYLTLGWRGKRLAWVAIIALFGITMATWGVQFAPTSYHLFKDIGGSFDTMSRPQ